MTNVWGAHTHLTSRSNSKIVSNECANFLSKKVGAKKRTAFMKKESSNSWSAVTAASGRACSIHVWRYGGFLPFIVLYYTASYSTTPHTTWAAAWFYIYTDSCYYCMRAADDKSSVTYAWSMWAPKLVKVNRFHASKVNWDRKLFFDINSFFDTGNLHLQNIFKENILTVWIMCVEQKTCS